MNDFLKAYNKVQIEEEMAKIKEIAITGNILFSPSSIRHRINPPRSVDPSSLSSNFYLIKYPRFTKPKQFYILIPKG